MNKSFIDKNIFKRWFVFSALLICLIFVVSSVIDTSYKTDSVKIVDIREQLNGVFRHNSYWPGYLKESREKLKINYTFQSKLTDKIKYFLKKYKSDYSAIVVIDNNTGAILSAVGYSNKEKAFIRSLPFSSSHPSASLFKIVTMAGLLESGEISIESPQSFSGSSTTLYKYQILKSPNQRWKRTQSFKKAFASSNNVIFGRAAIRHLKKNNLSKTAHKLGFNQDLMKEISIGQSFFKSPINDYNMAELASGFNRETMMSPVHAALLSSIVANNGIMKSPFMVSSLSNLKNAEPKWNMKKTSKRVIDRKTSEALFKVMEYTISDGTARKSFRRFDKNLKKLIKIGGKTGSITGGLPYGKRDWFSAFAVPHKNDKDKGISISVMNINLEKWFVRSAVLAKNIIEYYYKEIKPIEKPYLNTKNNKG